MKTYFFLQVKRMLKIFPLVLLITAILFSGLAAIFVGMMRAQNESENVQKFKIGIVGDTDNTYFSFGISALQTLDDTRFALELELLEEEEAAQKLRRRDISAYFVFPEGFVDAALYGEVKTIRMVTNINSGSLILVFKEEVAKAASILLEESQKGVYGVQSALESNGYQDLAYEFLEKMNVEYIDFVLQRSSFYRIEELGIADLLTLPDYYVCSLSVFFLLLLGLPYAILLVKSDWSLNRMLSARQFSSVKQVLSEYLSYIGALLLLIAAVAGILSLFGSRLPLEQLGISGNFTAFLLHLIPVTAMVAALHLLLFELSGSIINGILLQFFAAVSLCYITGCFYPIFTFPEGIQYLSEFLPTGFARRYLASSITGEGAFSALIGLLAFAVVFLAILVAVRKHKITAKAG